MIFATSIIIEGPFQRGVSVRLVAGAAAACVLYGAILLEREGRLNTPRWLTLLGDASYSIFFVHFTVLSAVARFCYAHLHPFPVPLLVWLLCLVLCGVCSGNAAHYLVERPLLRWMGRHRQTRKADPSLSQSAIDMAGR